MSKVARGCYHVSDGPTTVIIGLGTSPASVDSLTHASRAKLRTIAEPLTCEASSADRFINNMPKESANADAILEAIKKVEVVSELLEEKNKNNLKMIAERKVSGGKQIGPYARLLTYSPGEVIISEGECGGNTFYISVAGDLHVFVADESGERKNVGTVSAGTLF